MLSIEQIFINHILQIKIIKFRWTIITQILLTIDTLGDFASCKVNFIFII